VADSLHGLDTRSAAISANNMVRSSVVVKDLRLKDEDKDKESSYKDKDLNLKDEDLKIVARGSWRTRTFLEDNNIAVNDMDLNLTGAQWQISQPFVTQSLQDDGA